MYSHTSVEENYNALLELPIVKSLIKKNAKLRKENKSLKNLIYSLPEFRCECKVNPSINHVEIKQEKDVEEPIPMPCEPLAETDDVVYVSESEVKKINIVYEIEDEEEADAVEEEEEEEEEEGADAVEEEEEDEGADAVEDEEEEEEDDAVEEEEEEETVDAVEEEEEETTDAVEEEEEEELFAITVSGKSYYTSDKVNGKIYAIAADEEVGDEIGEFVSGKAKFYKK